MVVSTHAAQLRVFSLSKGCDPGEGRAEEEAAVAGGGVQAAEPDAPHGTLKREHYSPPHSFRVAIETSLSLFLSLSPFSL